MTTAALTLMAVHAHPDDEASMTGGILADAHARGITTVLVTCTDGALGDSPDGRNPEHDDHDPEAVVAHRHEELANAAAILGITHLHELRYRDSGMMGWPQNDAQGAFWNTPVAEAAARLAALIEQYQPDVIVTYDENGFYGHPDHIQANRITLAAIAETGSTVKKLFYTAIPKSWMAQFQAEIAAADAEGPGENETPSVDLGTDDAAIGAIIDTSAYAAAKRNALAAHGSQTANSFFLTMPEDRFASIFGREAFVRVLDLTGGTGVDDDLFARLG